MARKHHILLFLLASVLITSGCGDSGVHLQKSPPVENTDENDVGNENDVANETDSNHSPDTSENTETSACTTPCSGATPICNEGSGSCVECIDATHCTDSPNGATGVCLVDNTCSYPSTSCPTGFVDLDGNQNNGCECEITDANDVPDIDGKDTNCDGVDGVLGVNVLFVSTNGDDTNDGKSPNAPKKSIQNAIQSAATNNIPHVLVAAGEYNETITLADGISVHGGYDSTTWKRNIQTNDSIIKNTEPEYDQASKSYKAVIAQNLTKPTTLSAVTIIGPDADPTKKGASTFGLWSFNSQNLNFEHSVVRAGKAADGELGIVLISVCTRHPGGDGGPTTTTHNCGLLPPFENQRGKTGKQGTTNDPNKPNNGGAGGQGGQSSCSGSNGGSGAVGAAGSNGVKGSDATPLTASNMGSLSNDGRWLPPAPVAAREGQKGAGGGGGGAGGSRSHSMNNSPNPTYTLTGGAGGTGGTGGCGGKPGVSGISGGSSIAIATIGGKVTMNSNHIVLGKAGNGANGDSGAKGGPGSDGSTGAAGQIGVADTWGNIPKAGSGGKGGNGGNGGAGGTGAGGHGGNAIGLATSNNANVPGKDTLTYDATPAVVGQPGTSPNPALNGLPGKIETFITYTN